jgi:hypothetical protein
MRSNSAILRYLQRSPSSESIDRYLSPIVAILFLWPNRHMGHACRVALSLMVAMLEPSATKKHA